MHWKQQNISYFIATDMRKKEKICLIFYISVWHYYEAKSKLHNNRSIVVVTIM